MQVRNDLKLRRNAKILSCRVGMLQRAETTQKNFTTIIRLQIFNRAVTYVMSIAKLVTTFAQI